MPVNVKMSEFACNERDMKQKACRDMHNIHDPVEKIRCLSLQKGVSGIMDLGRHFRQLDPENSGNVSFDHFRSALNDLGLAANDQEYEHLFGDFVYQSEQGDYKLLVRYDELLRAIRPPMNDMRKQIVDKAFAKLDKDGNGVVSITDLKQVYNVKSNNAYLDGQKTEKELLEIFMFKFEENSPDGLLTRDEFYDYYSGVSASIDNDMYFDLMMRHAWKL